MSGNAGIGTAATAPVSAFAAAAATLFFLLAPFSIAALPSSGPAIANFNGTTASASLEGDAL